MGNFVRKRTHSVVRSAAAFVLFLSCLPLFAQVPTGTILGVVKDPSGASVPNVTVTALDTESNFTRTATTQNDGAFRFSALPVGHYEIQAEATGFKKETQTGLTLDVAQEAVVNFTLQVGTAEQQVEVTAEAPQVDTTTSSLAHLVTDNQIAELPLNGRSFVSLSLMQSGVTQYTAIGTGNAFAGTWYSSNGAPVRSNMYMLDGAIMGNIMGGSASSIANTALGVDGIREYKVMTNSYSAEYGLTMGSQMAIVTKSGSNQFHGNVFEYLRNSAIDARSFFDYLYTLPTSVPGGGDRVAPFRRNQFGGTLGGPIKKDKTFFFATYEGYREVLDNPTYIGIQNAFPAACHPKSASNPNGSVVATDPITNLPSLALGSACDSTLAAGKTEIMDAYMVPILQIIPFPNLTSASGQPQFDWLSTQTTSENYGQIRIDHNFSSKDTFFGRYTIDRAVQDRPVSFPGFSNDWQQGQQYLTLAEDHIFSPTLLNSARTSFSRSNVLTIPESIYNGPQYSCVTGFPVCGVGYSGGVSTGGASAGTITEIQNVFSWGDDVFWTKGKHALKFGTLIDYWQQYADPNAKVAGMDTITSLHAFLLGQYTNYTVPGPSNNPHRNMLFDTIGFYVQDDYRIHPRLTLNLGLRYEFNTTPEEKRGRQAYFNNFVTDTNSIPGPFLRDPSYLNFSPRVGFAWDAFGTGRTSVRGGFALLYDISNLGSVIPVSTAGTPPLGIFFAVTPTTLGGPKTFVLPFPEPTQAFLAPPAQYQGAALTTVNHFYKNPRILDFNLSVGQQLPFGTALSVAYAGSRGLHLWQDGDDNPRCPTSNPYVPAGCAATTTTIGPTQWLNVNAPRINPFFGTINWATTYAASWYNALQVNLTKRVGHGLEFNSGYTWSKSLDDTEGQISTEESTSFGTNFQENPFMTRQDWGPSNFDVRQNWRFSTLYHVPDINSEKFAAKLEHGWWMGSIVAVQTGYPFSPLLGSDREQSGINTSGSGIDRPSYVTSANIATAQAGAILYNPKTVIIGNYTNWYNANMFTLQPVGTVGTVGRNSLTGPGLATWDFSLNKDTAVSLLGEAEKVQFRVEVFNLLNHPNFGPPSPSAFTAKATEEAPLATAGQITTTSTDPREFQFSLKFLF